MHVLIVMPVAERRGGAEVTLMHLLRERPTASVTWEVIFLEHGPMVAEVRGMGWNATVIPAGRARDIYRLVRTVRKIASLAKERQAALILGWMAKSNLYSGPAAVIAGIPGLWYQVDTPKSRNALGRVAMAMPAKGVITNSKMVDQAQRALWPRRPTRVVYPAVDGKIFDIDKLPSPQTARARLGLPGGVSLIGLVGRLQKWKGIHTLVEAMPQILRSHPDVSCVIVGGAHKLEPDYPAFLADVIQRCRVEDRVILAGYQSNPELWMQAMDVVVHASSQEPFGLVVLEAMSLQKPIVAGDSGGPKEIITDGVDGILYPQGNPEALARAILSYLDDSEFAERISRAGRRRALDFTTDRYVATLVQAVQDLTSSAP